MGCVGRLVALALLVGIVAVAWHRGPDLRERVRPEPDPPPVSVPPPADSTLDRYGAVEGGGVDRATFSGTEVAALLLADARAHLPPGLEDLRIRFVDGEARIDVRLPFEYLPELTELERVRGVLPEAVPITLRGSLVTLSSEEAILVVRRVDAVGVPLPRTLFPAVLGTFGSGERPELPSEAVPIPLPTGVAALYIDDDRLVVGSAP